MHYLTDGREKYIYFPVTGEEQLFDLAKDRLELRDLARDPAQGRSCAKWRRRLVRLLAKRPDGFSDGKKLLRREWWSPVAAENVRQGP